MNILSVDLPDIPGTEKGVEAGRIDGRVDDRGEGKELVRLSETIPDEFLAQPSPDFSRDVV